MIQNQQELLERLLSQQENTLQLVQELYNTTLYEQILRPVLNDLLSLYDHIRTISALFPETQSDDNQAVLSIYAAQQKRSAEQSQALNTLQQTILDILYKNDIERLEQPTPGTVFNPRIHRAMRSEPGRKDQDRTIAQVLRDGFQYKDKILRPTDVVTYQSKQED